MAEPTREEMIAAVRRQITRMAGFVYRDATAYADDLAAMRAILRELEAGGWRPISEAPKDGTDIVALSNGDPWIVRWQQYPPGSYADGGWQTKALPGRDPIAYLAAEVWMRIPVSSPTASGGGEGC